MSPWWVLVLVGSGIFLIIRGTSWKIVLFIGAILFCLFIAPKDVMALATNVGNGFSNFITQFNIK